MQSVSKIILINFGDTLLTPNQKNVHNMLGNPSFIKYVLAHLLDIVSLMSKCLKFHELINPQ